MFEPKPATPKIRIRNQLSVWLVAIGLAIILAIVLLLAYQVPLKLDYQANFRLNSTLEKGLRGFFPAERNDAFNYRWSEKSFSLEAPLLGRQNYVVTIEALSAAPNPAPVLVKAGAREITTFTPTSELKPYRFTVSPDAVVQGGNLSLIWETTPFQVVGDNRQLGILVTNIIVESKGGGLVLPPLNALLGLWSFVIGLYLLTEGLLNGAGSFRGRWWVAGPVIGLGLAACGLAAFNRPLFAVWITSTTLYMAFAVFCLYFFFIGALILEKSTTRFLPKLKAQLDNLITYKPAPSDLSPRLTLVIGSLIALLGLGLRVINLEGLPIFLDEALHINAARAAQSGDLFVLATDGKVLHAWVNAALYQFGAGQDWLLITRLFSALCGLVTMGAAYCLAVRLHSRRAGLIAAGIWAILPFAVFHERMALVDPLMTALTASIAVFSLRLADSQSWYEALGWASLIAVAMTAAFLTKVPAIVTLGTPGLALLFYRAQAFAPSGTGGYFRRLSYIAPVCCFSFMLIIPVISSYAGVWNASQVNQKLSSGFNIGQTFQNLGQVIGWLSDYMTLPVLLAVIAALIWGLWQSETRLNTLFLAGSSLLPIIVLAALAQIAFPRYFLFTLVPLIVLLAIQAANLWDKLPNLLRRLQGEKSNRPFPTLRVTKVVTGVLVALLLIPTILFDGQAIFQPDQAPLPDIDRFQYVEGWASGYGVAEVAHFLEEQGRTRPVNALVMLLPITTKDSLEVVLRGDTTVQIQAVLPPEAGLENRIKRALKNGQTFLVLTNPTDIELLIKARQATPDLTYTLVFTGTKPGDKTKIEIYAVR